jgi:hypothetical protein
VSIELWNEAVHQLASTSPAPPISNLKRLTQEAVSMALASAKYALSIIPLRSALISPLNDAVDKMYLSLVNNKYAKALGLAVYIYETSADMLMGIGNNTAVAKEVLPLVVNRSYCTSPSFVAYNYYGYIQSLLASDPLSAEALSYTALFFSHLAEVNGIWFNSQYD